ncbi:MAG: hypothetical protein EBU46_19910, partial [Nitrosomonadaceae bacterium]|nr:hypothetical protein [Nitrosomonadaceae bacterium]
MSEIVEDWTIQRIVQEVNDSIEIVDIYLPQAAILKQFVMTCTQSFNEISALVDRRAIVSLREQLVFLAQISSLVNQKNYLFTAGTTFQNRKMPFSELIPVVVGQLRRSRDQLAELRPNIIR